MGVQKLLFRARRLQLAGAGTSTGGMAAEWSLVQLCLVESGVVTRTESFPDDQRDAALARLADLGGPSDAPVELGPATRGSTR